MPKCKCGKGFWPTDTYCDHCGRSRKEAFRKDQPKVKPINPPPSWWRRFGRWFVSLFKPHPNNDLTKGSL
jgi:hypothetical protein